MQINKIIVIFYLCSLIIVGSLINGCDVCETNRVYKVEEGDIYFSALPVNSTQPSIYRIDADGKNLKEVVKNGILCSPPTKDNKLVYLQENTEGGRIVVQSNIDGSEPRIIGDYSWAGKYNPIISPDGKYVAVSVGSKDLWIIANGTTFYKVTNKLCQNTMPVFSPDGTKIAFYEGYDLFSEIKVKVLNITINPPDLLSQTQTSPGISTWKGEALIDWSTDGKNIAYILSSSPVSDFVTISEWDNPGNSQTFEISGFGAYQPAISPDGKKLAFAGKDGNIWMRNLKGSSNYINLTGNTSQFGYSIYPQWSPDGNYIIYSKYFKDDLNVLHATLEIVNTSGETISTIVLSNNVYRAFWNKYK